ncbi:MAG: hypothetical protein RLY16_2257, partial [Bacteroidota bacterium]
MLFWAMKQVWYQKKWVIFFLHVMAWSLLFGLPFLLSAMDRGPHPKRNPADHEMLSRYFMILMNGSWVIYFYINAYFIIPTFVFKNRYKQFIAVSIFAYVFLAVEANLLQHFLLDFSFPNIRSALFNIFIFIFIFSLSLAYRMILEKIKYDRNFREKENENLKTELSLLRSQVSPHFMFNVLNNMVALARKQSDQLEPSLIKLSSLMRYMLYETDEEQVSLEREIDYVQSYIDLQQQRFGKKVQINVDMNPLTNGCQIEPMLLIPFVENAFKHGTGLLPDARIDIRLTIENGTLQFSVSNKFDPASKDIKDASSGIGLANVKRRLNLL